jgi:Ribbon-helix-helix domain
MPLSKHMAQLGCTVTVEQRDALAAVAKRLQIPMTELVRQAIDAYLASDPLSTKPIKKAAKEVRPK